jgi:hypothetical protein
VTNKAVLRLAIGTLPDVPNSAKGIIKTVKVLLMEIRITSSSSQDGDIDYDELLEV